MPQFESENQPAPYDRERVAVRAAGSGGLIAFRPGEFLASGDHAAITSAITSWAGSTFANGDDTVIQAEPISGEIRGRWRLYRAIPLADVDVDVLALIRGLRARGIAAQPNHVYFVTSLAAQAVQFSPNMFAPNMFAPNMFAPNMFAPNMFAPNMFAPNMFAPNMFAGGAGAGGCCCPAGPTETGEIAVPKLAARPVLGPAGAPPASAKVQTAQHVRIHVIDVANPGSRHDASMATGELPDKGNPAGRAIDENGDGWADPALGHGDFVRSIVELGCQLETMLWEAADPMGDIDDASLVKALKHVDTLASTAPTTRILNLSLSGYNEDDRPGELLAGQIADMIRDGWVIVAAAGNNASCRLAWPAALPGVVAVGALSDCAPAWFSNYGPWVDVSAPGVDIVGRFEVNPADSGLLEKAKVADADDPTNKTGKLLTAASFTTGWATWSGTSFAAPFVTARIARAIEDDPKLTGAEAVKQVVDDPTRDWVPYYGRLLR